MQCTPAESDVAVDALVSRVTADLLAAPSVKSLVERTDLLPVDLYLYLRWCKW